MDLASRQQDARALDDYAMAHRAAMFNAVTLIYRAARSQARLNDHSCFLRWDHLSLLVTTSPFAGRPRARKRTDRFGEANVGSTPHTIIRTIPQARVAVNKNGASFDGATSQSPRTL